MKSVFLMVPACLLFSLPAVPAGIDGKWIAELPAAGGKKAAAKEKDKTATVVLDLKSQGNTLTGTVSTGKRRRSASVAIQDGKIDGDKFSFATVTSNKKQKEAKFLWEGTVAGDEMRGTRTPAKGRRGVSFIAKRQP